MTPTSEPAPSWRNTLISGALPILLICWGIAIVTQLVIRNVAHLPYPEGSILFLPADRFADFIHYANQCHWIPFESIFTHTDSVPFILGPFAVVPYAIFGHIFHPHLRAGAIVYGILIVGFTLYLFRTMVLKQCLSSTKQNWALTTFVFLAFPLWFLIDRGNPEGFVFVFTALGIFAMTRDSFRLAAVLFAGAAAMKFFPAIFAILLIYRRNYTALVYFGCSFVLMTIIGLCLMDNNPVVALQQLLKDMAWYNTNYNNSPLAGHELRFYHSINAVSGNLLSRFPSIDVQGVIYGLIKLFSVILLPFLVWQGRKLNFINQVFTITLCMLLFAPMSADYRLIHLLPPLFLLMSTRTETHDAPTIRMGFIVAISIALAPISQLHLGGWWISGTIKCIALCSMLVLLLYLPIPSQYDKTDNRPA